MSVCFPAKALGIEEADFLLCHLHFNHLCPAQLAVQIDRRGLVAGNFHMIGFYVTGHVRQLLVTAVFVLADKTGNLAAADFLYHQHVQPSVGRVRLGNGIETAAAYRPILLLRGNKHGRKIFVL